MKTDAANPYGYHITFPHSKNICENDNSLCIFSVIHSLFAPGPIRSPERISQ